MIMIMFVMGKFIALMKASGGLIKCKSPPLPVLPMRVLLASSTRGSLPLMVRSVYISYGGLLMNLEGSYRKLSKLAYDNVYLLIRK